MQALQKKFNVAAMGESVPKSQMKGAKTQCEREGSSR